MTFTTLRLKISKLFGALEDNGRTFYSFGIVTDGGKTARHADFRYFVILSIYVVCCADFNVFETTCTCYNTNIKEAFMSIFYILCFKQQSLQFLNRHLLAAVQAFIESLLQQTV